MTQNAMILHSTPLSGHGHRVEQLLLMLDLPYVISPAPVQVRHSEAYGVLNPLRQIPVLQDGDITIADSNAILVYLVKAYAPSSSWLPDDAVGASLVQRWLSIAAGEVMHGPCTARMIVLWDFPANLERAQDISRRLLEFMDLHLQTRDWLAADHETLADLACHAYVAHAPEGGISLAPYPAVRRWLERFEGLPKFKPIPDTPIPGQ